jgi:hypothetical protein
MSLSVHQQKIMLQNNNIYPSFYDAPSLFGLFRASFQFHKRFIYSSFYSICEKELTLAWIGLSPTKPSQTLFRPAKMYYYPVRFGDGLIFSVARHPRSTGKPVLSFRPPLCPCVVLMFPHVLTSKPVALTLTRRRPGNPAGTHTFA